MVELVVLCCTYEYVSSRILGSSWTLRPAEKLRNSGTQELRNLGTQELRNCLRAAAPCGSDLESFPRDSEAVAESLLSVLVLLLAPCHDSLNFCFISNAIAWLFWSCVCVCVLAVAAVWVQGAGLPMGDRGGICVSWRELCGKCTRKEASSASRANRGSKAAKKEGSTKAARCTARKAFDIMTMTFKWDKLRQRYFHLKGFLILNRSNWTC